MDQAEASTLTSLHLPDALPVIMLSDCYLFPACFLPLFIFEMRYREMLNYALDTDRMFCVGTRLSGDDESDDIFPVSTAGLIRACVKQPDGTSHLMLYGMRRIRFTGWIQKKPFRIAKIEPMTTELGTCKNTLEGLKFEALKLLPNPGKNSCESMHLLKQTISDMEDPEAACDILSYHFVRRSGSLRRLMELPSLKDRYEFLLKELVRSKGSEN